MRKKTTFSRGFPTLIRPIAPLGGMTATRSVRRRSPANIPSRPSPTTIPMMRSGRTTRAIATRTRRDPPPGSRLWRRNLTTTNTKPKTNGMARRIVSLTTLKTMTTKPRPGLGVADSSWFWPCLGLVMIGAGGAFAYRAMFGGAILAPSLPPVIKANDTPNKIVPNRSDAQTAASNPAGAATPGSPEKLVSREEQPVAVQPANAPPRVVSTIPVPTAPGAAPAGPPAAVAPAPPAAPAQPSALPKVVAPAQPLAGSGEPKKIHTVTIRSDQIGNPNAAAPAPGPPPVAPAPAARPKATEAPARMTAPKAGGNAPLAIVPVAQGAAPAAEPPRSRVARTEAPSAPVAAAPAAAAGGYAVQVTSQRSEADAQTEFKALQAKFPSQLGKRQPIIHRADLGEKGTFYRALVGPFASSEAAAAMCSNLKAAGGSCIVQKN